MAGPDLARIGGLYLNARCCRYEIHTYTSSIPSPGEGIIISASHLSLLVTAFSSDEREPPGFFDDEQVEDSIRVKRVLDDRRHALWTIGADARLAEFERLRTKNKNRSQASF
jgi:hypothetical protein